MRLHPFKVRLSSAPLTVDKVECEKDKMLVYINERKVQEEFPGVTVDRYVVYVNNYKDTCKDDSGSIDIRSAFLYTSDTRIYSHQSILAYVIQ